MVVGQMQTLFVRCVPRGQNGPSPRSRTLAAALAVVTAGCHFETQGLEDILSPQPTYVNFPGKRIVKGQVSAAVSDWNGDNDRRVLAMRGDGELLIVKPETAENCSVGLVADFLPNAYLNTYDVQRPPMVALLLSQDDTGRGELAFSDWDCNVWPTGLERGSLSLREAADGYLAGDLRDDGKALLVVDPWRQQVHEVESGLTTLVTDWGGWSLAQAGTELVVRDPQLTERLRQSDVAEYLTLVNGGVVTLKTDGSLLVTDLATELTTYLGGDVCGLQGADIRDRSPYTSISFLDPCVDGSMKLYEHRWRTLRPVGLAGQFANARVAFDAYAERHLYVLDRATKLPATAPVGRSSYGDRYIGTLWGSTSPIDPTLGENDGLGGSLLREPLTKIGENAILPVTPGYGFLLRVGDPLALVDYDGIQGRLVVWEPGGATREVATSVTELDGGLAVMNWDGTSGEVLAAMQDPAVPLGLRVESLDVATVAYDGEDEGVSVAFSTVDGEFMLMRGSLQQWRSGLGLELEALAEGVLPKQYAWWSSHLLGYNRSDGNGGGTLTLRFTDTLDTFDQPGVSRWQFSNTPPGVLYFVDAGSKAGLWWAALR